MLERMIRAMLPGDISPTTYGLGILQAKSFRFLKAETARALKEYGITSVDWAILGTLFEAAEGLCLSDVSKELGVQGPLMTLRTNKLATKGLIKIVPSRTDSRQRLVLLTKKGRTLVPTIEALLRKNIKPLFHGASSRDLLGFVRVLARIVENNELDFS